ncbi:hypothetical protein DL764_001570 [Monosporascus ibericus]|uniref:Rhodopsin domain-containing protein n=1 Tax=Monosporascus ibericus TaxID=155417 RepID=A0A4V1XC94_9PEZI|nr:hypothetical protein DL764_001570 [Monosporascus ibericus]
MSNEFIAFDPNLVDENRGQNIFALCVLFTILIALSTASRIAMKLWTKIGLGAADYFIIICLAFNLTANILEIQAVGEGFGRHLQFLTREQVLTIKRLSQYNILLANIALWAVKISICFFILALVKDVHRRTKWIVYGLIAVTTTASTCQGIFWGLQAKPLRKLWMPEIPGEVASIETLVHSIITFTAINSMTDLFYALSPIYFFGRLQMSLGRRLVVIGLTGSGLLVFASSIIRVAFDGDFYDPDFTWALHNVYLCTIIERNLAEVIADLPASFAVLRSVRRKAHTIISRGAHDSTKSYTTSGQSGFRDKSFPKVSRGPQFSDNEPAYQEDEIPLRHSPHVPKDKRNITLQTSIDIQAHAVNDQELQQSHQELVHPWDKTSRNV